MELIQTKGDIFFELMAELDLTKHSGEFSAPHELVDLCHITTNTYILDVGSGEVFHRVIW